MTSSCTWEKEEDGTLVIRIPPSSERPFALPDSANIPCIMCETKNVVIEKLEGDLEKPCPLCPVYKKSLREAKDNQKEEGILVRGAESALNKLTNRIQHYNKDQRVIGKLEAEVGLYKPAFLREQKSLCESKSSRIGKAGEKSVFTHLNDLVGQHSSIRITNTLKDAGDMQIFWKTPESHREALITVEVKSSEIEGMVKSSMIEQASTQILETKADAGILFYKYAVDRCCRIKTVASGSLVVVGYYNQHGQILSGLLHAILIAQRRVDLEMTKGDLFTASEKDECAKILDLMENRVSTTRKDIYEIRKIADRSLSAEKKGIIPIIEAVEQLPEKSRSMFSNHLMQKLRVGNEKLTTVSQASKKRKSSGFRPLR